MEEEIDQPASHIFQGATPGSTVPIPGDMFRLFFTSELIQLIRYQTNRYALDVMGGEKFLAWDLIICEDIKAYLGLNFLLRLNPKPSVRDVWRRNSIYYYPPIATRMPGDRQVHALCRQFHLVIT